VHHKRREHAHAEHSLRGPLGVTRAHEPPTSLGNTYPLDDVVAVIDDRASAEQAMQALTDAGLPGDDVDLLDGPSVTEAWLSSAFSDDAAYARAYALEAERGHYLVIAHAPQPEVVERVRQVLSAYGAHSMRHYEELTVTDLF
jgi:hypothetical protein